MAENTRIQPRPSWGILLVLLGLLGLSTRLLPSNVDLIGMIIPAGIATVFAVVYLSNRQNNWWALIPMWVFLMGATAVGMSELYPRAEVAIPLTLMAAVPFIVVYLSNRKQNWWALIPAYVFIVGATIIFTTETLGWSAEAIAPVLVGLPFFVVYANNPAQNWWALIPGGILVVVGGAFMIDSFPIPLAAILMIAGGIYILFSKPKQAVEEAPPAKITEEIPPQV